MPATTYDWALAVEICELMRNGMTLPKACEHVGVPRKTFLDWVDADRDGLSARYAHARKRLLDYWAEQIIDIADDRGSDAVAAHNSQRLSIDARKWLLSKLRPEQYGDSSKQTIDMTVKGQDPATVLAARRKARGGG